MKDRLLIGYSFLIIVVFFMLSYGCNPSKNAVGKAGKQDDFATAFATPQDTLKPWVYYYWISNNISKEGITKDLEAMAKIGIGQTLIGNIGLDEVASGSVPILSEEWWQLTEHAIREGKRLGINIGLFNCPGWSQSGGPWVKTGEAMRYLVNTEITVDGGRQIIQKIAAPKDTFQDIKVIAFPAPKDDNITIADVHPIVTSSANATGLSNIADGNTNTLCTFPVNKDTVTLDIKTSQPFTARSLVIYPASKPFSATVQLQMLENGMYKTVSTFLFDRTNPGVNVGPVPYAPVAISFPQIASNNYRFIFSNIRDRGGKKTNAAFGEIALTPAPKLERYEEKQLAKMFQTPVPLWKEFQWPNQMETMEAGMYVKPMQVMDISKNLGADGTLNWDAPAGKWIVMRIGATPTGTMNGPSAPNARGLEVDKMNKTYLENHFNAYMGKLLERMPADDRTAFKHVVMDSYEMGPENWTEGLAEDFSRRYGYDPIRWLPVLSGRIVGSADQSNRFLWDLRRLIADRVAYDYVGGLRDISAKHGLRIWLENYGHWGFPSEFLMYGGQSHEIAGEFWNEGELGNIECRAASSAAHIYGHTKVYAESYTSGGKAYERYPALLKKRGDWSFTEGINSVLLHLYIQQPYEDKTPGINAPFGTEFNRKNTWFEQSKNWIDYQRRCMYMLQRGQVVNDVAYFIGEDAPKMTGTRNPEIPKGYQYDYINAEVIKQRVKVEDGKLVLPDGMSYRLLVLPQLETMRPELLRKIKDLVADGATILGPSPHRSPSLQNYPATDKEVQRLAAELWGDADGKNVTSRKYGKGLVLSGVDIKTAMEKLNVKEDIVLSSTDPVLYIHRREAEKEIYFITNQSDKAIDINPSFRVEGKQPELFDATDGSHRLLPKFTQQKVSTTVPIHLEPTQSFFIVFRNKINTASGTGVNFPAAEIVQTITSPWQVVFDKAIRGPKSPVTFPQLTDWSKNADTTIKYYSGTAIYSNNFQMAEKRGSQRILLDLGDVKNMAVVKINGIQVGAVWCPPYQVDITNAIKKGDNQITVEVVNTWVNRLVGDSRLPEAQRKTWLSINTFKPAQALESSGLIGEVKLLGVKY
jgi:hypothetical protein